MDAPNVIARVEQIGKELAEIKRILSGDTITGHRGLVSEVLDLRRDIQLLIDVRDNRLSVTYRRLLWGVAITLFVIAETLAYVEVRHMLDIQFPVALAIGIIARVLAFIVLYILIVP